MHVVVSVGVYVGGKGHLCFVDEKAKVIAAYYLEKLLSKLVEDCEQLLLNGFIFQQDGTVWLTWQASQRTGCSQTAATSSPRMSGSQFTRSESTGLSRLGTMVESYHKLQSKPKTIPKLKAAL